MAEKYFSLLRTPDSNTAILACVRARMFPQKNNNSHSLKSSRISRIRSCAGHFGLGISLALTVQFGFSGGTRNTAGREEIGHSYEGEGSNSWSKIHF